MRPWILLAAVPLAACGGETAAVRPAAYVPVPRAALPANLAAIKGQTAPRLIAQLGAPRLDITEGNARKLQFAGPICVLDAYLYPPSSGRGEPVATYFDARQRDGSPIDQASCLAALGKRPGMKP
jgi:hypothetical protein